MRERRNRGKEEGRRRSERRKKGEGRGGYE